jgi:hypothetical protein
MAQDVDLTNHISYRPHFFDRQLSICMHRTALHGKRHAIATMGFLSKCLADLRLWEIVLMVLGI